MKKTIILSTIITSLFLTNANAIDPVSAVVVGSSVIGAGASIYTASKASDTNKKVNNIVAQNNKSNSKAVNHKPDDKTINVIKCYVPASYRYCQQYFGKLSCYETATNLKKGIDGVLVLVFDNDDYPLFIETVETLKYHKCVLI
jgi:hypothetical protein